MIFVAMIAVLSMAHSQSFAFNEQQSGQYIDFAFAAYCSADAIASWDCLYYCKDKSFKVTGAFNGEL